VLASGDPREWGVAPALGSRLRGSAARGLDGRRAAGGAASGGGTGGGRSSRPTVAQEMGGGGGASVD
jgi:hypothetical protein